MRPLALLAALAMGVSALASGNDWLVGSYKLELAADVKTTAQKLGMAEPCARIQFRPDGTFSYSSTANGNATSASGTYELNDRRIRLVAAGQFPAQGVKSLEGEAKDGALLIDGLRYVKADVNFNVVGTWTLPDTKSVRIVFKGDKTFEYSGMAATSKGKYTLDDGKLTLYWTEVDGEAVEAGSMHKVILLREDGSFNIDSYRYVKG